MHVLTHATHNKPHVTYLDIAQPYLAVPRKKKTTPFGVKLMRSQVIYQAAQGLPNIPTSNRRPYLKLTVHVASPQPM